MRLNLLCSGLLFVLSYAQAQQNRPEVNFLGIDLHAESRGWRIESLPESADEESPLRTGDMVTRIAGHETAGLGPLSIAALMNTANARNLPVRIERQGQERDFPLFRVSSSATQGPDQTRVGAAFQVVEDAQRILVTEVVPGSPAELSGLRRDDELLAIDGKEIGALTSAQIAQQIDGGSSLPRLRIRRDGKELNIVLRRFPSSQPFAALQRRGEPAPDFTVKDLAGKHVSLHDIEGKPVLLTFWSASCGPCVSEAALINELQQEWERRLVVLALDVDDEPQVVHAFLQSRHLAYQVLIAGRSDGPIAKLYGLDVLPLTVILDARRFVHYLQVGFTPNSPLESRIRALLASPN